MATTAAHDMLAQVHGRFGTILADPPWRFQNRTGKMAPEHQRLMRYSTLDFEEIYQLPVGELAAESSHLYLWVPNALLAQGLETMQRWGFTYKTNLVWYKIRKDGGPDGRGVGFYFRNVTELVLFGVRNSLRTLSPGRRQVNLFQSMKREHSRKPEELFDIIEACSPGPYLELFARHYRKNWRQWGNEVSKVNEVNEVNEVDVVNRVNTANPFAEGVLQPMALEPSASANIVQLALLDTRASDKMGAAIRRSRNGHHQ